MHLQQDRLIQLMVGRTLDKLFPKEEAQIGETVLQVEGLRRDGVFRDISFELRTGEVAAFAGPSGTGKTTIISAIPRFIEPAESLI